jgi:hypothetical protein
MTSIKTFKNPDRSGYQEGSEADINFKAIENAVFRKA